MNGTELKLALAQCTGGDCLYAHTVKPFQYTEGMRTFFLNAGGGAYWLSDILATEPAIFKGAQDHGFCVAILEVIGSKAKLVVARDLSVTNNPDGTIHNMAFDTVVFERLIEFTDCPEGVWKFYLQSGVNDNGTAQMVALLPSEY